MAKYNLSLIISVTKITLKSGEACNIYICQAGPEADPSGYVPTHSSEGGMNPGPITVGCMKAEHGVAILV